MNLLPSWTNWQEFKNWRNSSCNRRPCRTADVEKKKCAEFLSGPRQQSLPFCWIITTKRKRKKKEGKIWVWYLTHYYSTHKKINFRRLILLIDPVGLIIRKLFDIISLQGTGSVINNIISNIGIRSFIRIGSDSFYLKTKIWTYFDFGNQNFY